MENYLDAIDKKEQLNKEIAKIDQKIDHEVFQLYGLSEEDIKRIKNT